MNGIQFWKGAVARARQQSVHKAGLAAEQRPQPSERCRGKAAGTLCPNSRAGQSESLPEIPARSVQQPRNMSPLPALPELFKGGFSQSLVISRERTTKKKNTRGSKHPSSLRTALKRALSPAPFTCFCVCQVPGRTHSRRQAPSRQSRAAARRGGASPPGGHARLGVSRTGSRRARFPGQSAPRPGA